MMKHTVLLSAFALFLCAVPGAGAQSATEDKDAIVNAINAQAGDWNKGNIDGFMHAYEDSADTIFVGENTHKGYQEVLHRYKQTYGTRSEMGLLSFSDIDVRVLPNACGKSELALATGRYHLTDSTRAKKEGLFSLVWRRGPHGWKIILDHTS